jgi:hypothetical protein
MPCASERGIFRTITGRSYTVGVRSSSRQWRWLGRICLVLSGLGWVGGGVPRALPWAGMSRPFRTPRVMDGVPRALPWAGMSRPFRTPRRGDPCSQGVALGWYVSSFQDSTSGRSVFPGRCPGLVCLVLSGLGGMSRPSRTRGDCVQGPEGGLHTSPGQRPGLGWGIGLSPERARHRTNLRGLAC